MGTIISSVATAALLCCVAYLLLLGVRIAQVSEPITKLAVNPNDGAWAGIRKFVLEGKVLECESICSFYLKPHDGKPLPQFLPGQYLTFQFNIPGQARPTTRCYSLSDSPNHPDYYRITVKRIPPPRDQPDAPPGLSSSFVHHTLQAGDIVDVKAPSGHFYLDVEHHGPVVLIGGGIGVTPMISMLNYITELGSTRETHFFYGVRNSTEHVMKDWLKAKANEHENIHLHVCYSNPLPDDEEGEDYQYQERVSVDLFKQVLPSSNYDYCICGPAPLMDSVTADLKTWGVPESKVHFEAFGPASVKRVAKSVDESVTFLGVEITFARSGKTLAWDGTSPSLLEFAEANGIAMDSGCRAGNCGTCVTAIRSGEVEYLTEPGSAVENGTCLACISIPKTALSIDA
jgi:ferredoxin-NADP reductase